MVVELSFSFVDSVDSFFLFFFLLVVLGIELRVLHMEEASALLLSYASAPSFIDFL
jgi:hypothetical protein